MQEPDEAPHPGWTHTINKLIAFLPKRNLLQSISDSSNQFMALDKSQGFCLTQKKFILEQDQNIVEIDKAVSTFLINKTGVVAQITVPYKDLDDVFKDSEKPVPEVKE